MLTIDAIRAALGAPSPFAQMDLLVRAELGAGRNVKEVFDELKPLVDAVLDTPELTEDAEEAFLGTLDALSGNCHRDCQYESPPRSDVGLPNHTAASKSV